MRLSEFIRTRPGAIEREWEKFVGPLNPFAPTSKFSISSYDLRGILHAIADDMESPQTSAQQREKSQGKAAYEDALDRITGEHASLRLDSGFNLEHVVAEYRALRASVLWLWSETNRSNEEQDLEEVIRFNETIDQAIAEVTRRFADRATRYSDRFLGILAHDVRSPLHLIKLAAEHLLVDGARKETRTDDASRIFRGGRRIERLE